LPRENLLRVIEAMARKTRLKLPVMLSDCTDPYQPLERRYKITRKCLEVLAKHNFPLLIVTKSDMVLRDIDILHSTPTVVSLTITTFNEEVAKFWEPNAPPPKRRIRALKKLAEERIATTVRIDPIIPSVNDNPKEFEELMKVLAEIGVKQVTASTFKPVRGFFINLKRLNYGLYKRLLNIYSDGKWILGYKYLSDEKRLAIMERLRRIVLKYGLEFSLCREGFPELSTIICDGTAYCRNVLDRFVS
jgi:DNA repair photolyase